MEKAHNGAPLGTQWEPVGVRGAGAVAASHLVILYIRGGYVHNLNLNSKTNTFFTHARRLAVNKGRAEPRDKTLRSTGRSALQPSPTVAAAGIRL